MQDNFDLRRRTKYKLFYKKKVKRPSLVLMNNWAYLYKNIKCDQHWEGKEVPKLEDSSRTKLNVHKLDGNIIRLKSRYLIGERGSGPAY